MDHTYMYEYLHLNRSTLKTPLQTRQLSSTTSITVNMKVLSLAMAFFFAAIAVATPMDGLSSNKLAERQVWKYMYNKHKIM
jgi:hypothetical protein